MTNRLLTRRTTASRTARGFSLIELLVVISIIALIISIIVPAIASARKSARKADTINLCNGLSQSCSQFILDQRRPPGYFSQRDMGSAENMTRGFSQMENAMLELAGGIVAAGQPTDASDLTDVGPVANSAVRVRTSLIGAGGKSYFSSKAKNYREQDGVDADGGNRNSQGDNREMPVLVDSEGMPILMWTVDDTARKELVPAANIAEARTQMVDFARETSAGAAPARLYWASNSAFLSGNALVGKYRVDESTKSVIGSANTNHAANFAALMGNPNSPLLPKLTPPPAGTPDDNYAASTIPSAARGSVIIHAAGSNNTYFGATERGAARRSGGIVYYGDTFVPGPKEDIAAGFDDILISGN